MLLELIFLTMSYVTKDPVAASVQSFARLRTYAVTVRSKSPESAEEFKYYYKKPGFVRMEFENPRKGAVLVYNPVTKRVQVRPFKSFKFFVLEMNPDDSILKSGKGHTVDKSDFGALLRNVEGLRDNGNVEVLGTEEVAGRRAVRVMVEGTHGKTVYGIHKYELWLDEETNLPVKVKAYDLEGELSEEVVMEDLEVNPELGQDLFMLE